MPSGTFINQNKISPGTYVAVQGNTVSEVNTGTYGIVAIAKELDWGEEGKIISITDITTTSKTLGYSIGNEKLLFLREMFLGTKENISNNVLVDGTIRTDGANEVLLYRLTGTGGVKASAELYPLTVTANYTGVRGNDVTIVITPDIDTETEDEGVYAVFVVRTLVDNLPVHTQRVGSFTSPTVYEIGTVGDLSNNDWVTFSGTATAQLVATTGLPLVNGENPTITNESYALFLDELEKYYFDIIAYDGTDNIIKQSYYEFITRVWENYGNRSQLITSNFTQDNEFVTQLVNGFETTSHVYPANEAVWWMSGVSAGCPLDTTLTYKTHPNAIKADIEFTQDELDNYILTGAVAFFTDFGEVRVLSDINTLVTYEDGKVPVMSQNSAERTIRRLLREVKLTLNAKYVGKYKNNATTWDFMRSDVIQILNDYLSVGAIDGFVPAEQTVVQGDQPEGALVTLNITIGYFLLKIYVRLNVQ